MQTKPTFLQSLRNKQLLSLFFFPVFFLLHGYNENVGLIPLKTIAELLPEYTMVTAGVLLLSVWLLRFAYKAYLLSFVVLFFYFFFGPVHDLLKGAFPESFITRYTVLLPVLGLTLGYIIYLLRRTQVVFKQLVSYLFALTLVLSFLEIAALGYNTMAHKSDRNFLGFRDEDWGKPTLADTAKPDIFFIVFDGYTSSKCLKEEFNYNNTKLDSTLAAHRFFVSEKSVSPYSITHFSLAATFEANYLSAGAAREVVTSKRLIQAVHTFKKSRLPSFLARQGYQIENIGCYELDGYPAAFSPSYFNDLPRRQIDEQTLPSRIWRDIGWIFLLKNVFTGKFRRAETLERQKHIHLQRNRFNYQQLLKALRTTSAKPRFVYAHLILPHEPFYLDAEGKEIPDSVFWYNRLSTPQGYLNQVSYANKLMEPLIAACAGSGKRPRVVLLQGDHGYRTYKDPGKTGKELQNLNAYYFSDGDYSQLYNGIGTANSFRVVLNKYFGSRLPPLKDTGFYLRSAIEGK